MTLCRWAKAALCLIWVGLAGCATEFRSPLPAGELEVAWQEGAWQQGSPPSAEDVALRMSASFRSTPVLHVTVRNLHHGVEYQCQGWIKEKQILGEVRRGGGVIFAIYKDTKRVQEYSPSATFANSSEAKAVLLEYDYDLNDGGWNRLVDYDLSCGPAGIAWDAYLWVERSSFGEISLGNMESSVMKETSLNGRDCYWYHLDDFDTLTQVTWDLYVDKLTYEPVREYRRITTQGKVTKEDTYDFAFEHLPNDNGIHWGLEVDKLRADSVATPK